MGKDGGKLGCGEREGCDRQVEEGSRGEHDLRRLKNPRDTVGTRGSGRGGELRSQDRKAEDERGDKGNWGDVTVDQHHCFLQTPIVMPARWWWWG